MYLAWILPVFKWNASDFTASMYLIIIDTPILLTYAAILNLLVLGELNDTGFHMDTGYVCIDIHCFISLCF